jgi:hypothetical protein
VGTDSAPFVLTGTTPEATRYVILLDGVTRSGKDVAGDFAPIASLLQASPNPPRIVYFSYGAADYSSSSQQCRGWKRCDWRNEPIYTARDTTKHPVTEHAYALRWLLDEITKESPTARIDLVGFSLGGIVATRWAALQGSAVAGPPHNVRAIVLIESPVGGLAVANACTMKSRNPWCVGGRLIFGGPVMRDLQLPIDDKSRSESIVESLKDASRYYEITAIESRSDYVVNGMDFPFKTGPTPIGIGSQAWLSSSVTRRADRSLGGSMPSEPVAVFPGFDLIIQNHTAPLSHRCLLPWVDQALQLTTASKVCD